MVQRTDIAGSVECSTARATPGDDGIERRPHQKRHFPETFDGYLGGKKCGRLFTTALPSVHAVYVETHGPMKR